MKIFPAQAPDNKDEKRKFRGDCPIVGRFEECEKELKNLSAEVRTRRGNSSGATSTTTLGAWNTEFDNSA